MYVCVYLFFWVLSLYRFIVQLCLTLCDPMNCSTLGFPVLHHLLELAQTHVHRVGDAIEPFHSLSSPCPPSSNLSPASGSLLMTQLFTSGGQSLTNVSLVKSKLLTFCLASEFQIVISPDGFLFRFSVGLNKTQLD